MEQTIELLNLLKGTTQIEFNNLDRVLKRNEVELQKNIYFVAGLKEKMFKRCNDDDIYLKKYFVVDIDIRLDCFKQTGIVLDNTQLMEHMANLLELIQDAGLDDYSAIVHSGNGLHLYYIGTERAFDKDVYSNGVRSIYEVINNAIKSTGYKCDPACHNISRIMRLPGTINPRKKEILNKETKEKTLAYDLGDFTCNIIDINPKMSKLFESIEDYSKKYQDELEKEKADAVVVHKILKQDYKKSDDIWADINRIPACDIACDIRPITLSDKGKDNVAFKEADKNMGAYWYRPTNVIVNTGSSMIKTNKSYFTSYELVFHEYANQDAKKTLEYFEKWGIKIHEKNGIIIPKKEFVVQGYEYPGEAFSEFDCVMSGELMVIVALSNSGKAQPLDSLVLTPTGYVTMGSINVGDMVVGIDGKEKKVLAIPSYGEQNIYRLTMSDGTQCDAGEFHEFRVSYTEVGTNRYFKEKDIEVIQLKEMLDSGSKLRLPLVDALDFDNGGILENKLDPYTLGVLIGDGGLNGISVMLSCEQEFIRNKIIIPKGDKIAHVSRYDYRISGISKNGILKGISRKSQTMQIIEELGLNGLSHQKFIPEIYLNSSLINRISLLNGLMDTDGEVMKRKNKSPQGVCYKYGYSTTSEKLRDDFCMLVKSLGGNVNINKKQGKYKKDGVTHICRMCYIITFSLPEYIEGITLPSKRKEGIAKRKRTTKIVDIQYIGKDIAKCISVEDGMYITDGYIPTHNTTYSMDMINANASKGKKCFYINLEFPIETMWRSRWLFLNGKSKRNLTDLDPLSPQEKEQMDEYVSKQLVKFDSYSNPKGIELEELVEMVIEKNKEGYGFFVVDTFSRIKGNLDSAKAHTTQNKCMEVLQDLCQSLGVVIVLLHHTNKAGGFEGSQKIMDLANVFLMMARDEDMFGERITKFSLTKDKFVSYKEIETVYKHGEYTKSLPN